MGKNNKLSYIKPHHATRRRLATGKIIPMDAMGIFFNKMYKV